MRIQGTDQYTVWNTDSNGNFVSNGTGGVVVSGSNSAITSLETSFNQDINGDGVIGASVSSTVIESFGSTSLVQVGSNYYFYPVGGSSGPQFKYKGSPVAVGQYEWSFIGVEQTVSGYKVAMRIQGTDQYTVWNTDSNGDFVSNGTGGVVVSGSNSAITSLETSFNQDINGDGVIGASVSSTVIESFGSTSLVQVGSNYYFYPVGGSSGPQFKYKGSPVAVGQYEWSFIGVEQTVSGYKVAMRIQGTDQYTVWNTDSNGDFVSNGTGGVVVSGSNSAITSLETSFNQDINGDGIISSSSIPVASACVVQAGNNIHIWQDGVEGFPVAVAQNGAWSDSAAGLKAGHEVSVHGQDLGGEGMSRVLEILSASRGNSQDSFAFRTDHFAAHADVTSSDPLAGWQFAAIVHEQAQVAALGGVDLHSNLIGATPDGLASHLADLLFGHFTIQ